MSTAVFLDQISTRWSQIHDPLRFVMRYSQAIRAYLQAILRDPEAAEEACQEFLAKFLDCGLEAAAPDRGRFRDYLKISVRNTAIGLLRRKPPTQVELAVLEGIAVRGADDAWLQQWQSVILDKAWRQLESHEHSAPSSLYFTTLRLSIEHPHESSLELAARAREQTRREVSAVAFRKQLSRARRHFAELIIGEVSQTISGDSRTELTEELVELGLWPYVKEYLPQESRGS